VSPLCVLLFGFRYVLTSSVQMGRKRLGLSLFLSPQPHDLRRLFLRLALSFALALVLVLLAIDLHGQRKGQGHGRRGVLVGQGGRLRRQILVELQLLDVILAVER